MANTLTIFQFPDGTIANNDLLPFWSTSTTSTRKTTVQNFVNFIGTQTGNGTLTTDNVWTGANSFVPNNKNILIAPTGTGIFNVTSQTTIGPIPTIGSEPFVIVGDGGARNAGQLRFQNNANAPSWNFKKARGTAASPVIVQNSDGLGEIAFQGYDGSAFTASSRVVASVNGTPSVGVMPGLLTFFVNDAAGVEQNVGQFFSSGFVTPRIRTPLIETASGPLVLSSFTNQVSITGSTTNQTLTLAGGVSSAPSPTIGTNGGDLRSVPFTGIFTNVLGSTTEAIVRSQQNGTGDASVSWFLDGANEIKATAVRSAAQLRFTAANPFNFGAFDYATGNVSWGGFPGGEAHRFVPTASALQWLVSKGGVVGVPASLDTNQGGLQIKSAGEIAARFTSVASAVNQWIASSQSTGNIPYWITNSLVDTNVPGAFGTQGSGALSFFSGGSTNNIQAQIPHTASANTFVTLTGAAGGGAPKIGVGGVGTVLSITSAGGGIFMDPSNSGAAAASFTGSNARFLTFSGSATNPTIGTSAGGITITSALTFTNQTVGTTVGAVGAASALPALPLGYLTLGLNAIGNVRIPYYN